MGQNKCWAKSIPGRNLECFLIEAHDAWGERVRVEARKESSVGASWALKSS